MWFMQLFARISFDCERGRTVAGWKIKISHAVELNRKSLGIRIFRNSPRNWNSVSALCDQHELPQGLRRRKANALPEAPKAIQETTHRWYIDEFIPHTVEWKRTNFTLCFLLGVSTLLRVFTGGSASHRKVHSRWKRVNHNRIQTR